MSKERWKTHIRGAMLALISSCCFAATSFAACTTDPDAAAKAASFLGNPSSLFNGPNGARSSDEIIGNVRDFVAANPQALPAVIALLKGASVDQQQAIGTGLGNASDTCKLTDLNFALEIQTQLANSDSSEAQTKFAAVTGNPIRTVAAGGPGGGVGVSGGGVGGQTNPFASPGSNTNFQTFTSNSVSNTPGSYFSASVGGAGAAGSSSTTTNTTIVCTVSTSC